MTSKKIRTKFLEFFKQKGHTIVPSSSLIPEDPTVLLTSAGMQQFSKYLSGEEKAPFMRATSCQKCFRTSDIDLVGDRDHLTFFEMLGNWSFGDYFKKEAFELAWEFLTREMKIDPKRLWITVFKGEKGIPRDEEAIELWHKIGVPQEKISEFGMDDNFWGPVGETGPCGPTSEIHYDLTGKPCSKGKECKPNCECGRFTEIWNLVLMQYKKKEKGEYESLPAKNIDTGMGLERMTAAMQSKGSVFETDLFLPLMQKLASFCPPGLKNNIRPLRIVVDHIRGAVFLISDGVVPGREEKNYILRRVIRRAVRYGKLLGIEKQDFLEELAKVAIENYSDVYPDLEKNKDKILTVIRDEVEKFTKTLNRGLKLFERVAQKVISNKLSVISGTDVFHLYDTYGFPVELTEELAREKGLKIDKKGFEEAFKKHKEISRAGVERKFGGVGKWGKKVARQHTATHLLHRALQDVLGPHVKQMGSDLTPERLRFDFSHPQKMTDEEKKKVEDLVNAKIKEDLPVKMEEMFYEEALKSGALAFFKEKYPKIVKVYSIGDYSKEICAGPHVKHTGELGRFKIVKEQSSGAGVRRIKAVLE